MFLWLSSQIPLLASTFKKRDPDPSIEIVLTQILIKIGLPSFTAISQNIQWIPTSNIPDDELSRLWIDDRSPQIFFDNNNIKDLNTVVKQVDQLQSLFGSEMIDTPSLPFPQTYIINLRQC
ncbi:unnamed protein product [Gordionus sp. m RMFG-2023]